VRWSLEGDDAIRGPALRAAMHGFVAIEAEGGMACRSISTSPTGG
jgi:hypothetical protein